MASNAAFQAAESGNSTNGAGGTTNIDEINRSTQPGWKPGSANELFDLSGVSQGATFSAPAGIGALDPQSTRIGVFQGAIGWWYLDKNGGAAWDTCGTDKCAQWGQSGDIAVYGDWNIGGTTKIGVFRPSTGYWFIDTNGTGTVTSIPWGQAGDIPVVGDWTGNGRTRIGVFRPSTGYFMLDTTATGTGAWTGCTATNCIQWGQAGDMPIVGDWNGDGKTKVGIFRPASGTFILDTNGNGVFNACGTDACTQWGNPTDTPVVGDWNGNGTTKVGVYRPSVIVGQPAHWFLDTNGNGVFDGCGTDGCVVWGGDATDIPVVGDWNNNGRTEMGVYRVSNGYWYLDLNGNNLWDNCGTDSCYFWGGDPTDQPVVGKW